MSGCFQTENQTVFQHGLSVWEHTKKIISGQFEGFILPDWLIENHAEIVNDLHDVDEIKFYNIYHDCGKPFCLVEDEKGRHFPDHANVSAEIAFQLTRNAVIKRLVESDMSLHSETLEQCLERNWSRKDFYTLLITAFAELHSNAKMFGGTESVSFKIKWKKVNQRGKALFSKLRAEKKHHYYSYVIVRDDLNNIQKTVQGTHAAMAFVEKDASIPHYSVIYLKVNNERDLKKAISYLLENEINISIFREPDLDNEITAICTKPLMGEERKILKRFQLLK
jgi:hypothetical protein